MSKNFKLFKRSEKKEEMVDNRNSYHSGNITTTSKAVEIMIMFNFEQILQLTLNMKKEKDREKIVYSVSIADEHGAWRTNSVEELVYPRDKVENIRIELKRKRKEKSNENKVYHW